MEGQGHVGHDSAPEGKAGGKGRGGEQLGAFPKSVIIFGHVSHCVSPMFVQGISSKTNDPLTLPAVFISINKSLVFVVRSTDAA